ncbi:15807_t:CDS:2, partial [Gigaspora margarita]
MDSSSEPINHEDTSISPSADINENGLDCVAIPEIIGDDISELSSEETVPTGSNHSGPSTNKKFLNKKNKEKEKAILLAALKIAPGTNNAFDLMRPQKQKNTNHNNDIPNVSVGSNNTTKERCLFEEVYIDNIRHSVCNIEMADGEACGTKVKT